MNDTQLQKIVEIGVGSCGILREQLGELIMQRILNILILLILCPLLMNCTHQTRLDQWEYVLIDSTRTGNDANPKWGTFGMDVADGNKDGFSDILAGKFFYLNPGENSGVWSASIIKDSVDGIFITDIDGDSLTDVIALGCNKQYWLEAQDAAHQIWDTHLIGEEPICNHKLSAMGFLLADIFPNGVEELIITDKPGKIYCFERPADPADFWSVSILSDSGGTEKSIFASDLDQDGLLDLVTGYQVADEKQFKGICWFQNTGKKEGAWPRHTIGQIDFTADHFGAADFDGDGTVEILVTEGRYPDSNPAGIYLFKAPGGDVRSDHWLRSTIIQQNSTNSLVIVDMDGDGDPDFVTGEHKGTKKLQVFENLGEGRFSEHVIDSLKESHNGALVKDIDGDGDLDIVSTGFYDKSVHLWINRSK